MGTELYDHRSDAEEMVNLAERAEQAELVKQLRGQLEAAMPGARATIAAREPANEADV